MIRLNDLNCFPVRPSSLFNQRDEEGMKPLGMQGLVAAVVTPMTDTGELNLGLVPQIVDHLERNSIAGVYIAGSSGEGMSLADEERMAVADA